MINVLIDFLNTCTIMSHIVITTNATRKLQLYFLVPPAVGVRDRGVICSVGGSLYLFFF